VPLPGERYLWARPYDFLHEALDWFDRLLLERGEEALRTRLTKSRSKVTETMTGEIFARTFGASRTYLNLKYQVAEDEWAETDAVVDLPAVQIAVEAKGHRLTDPGRAADPARVRTKFDELVTEPLHQSARARTALLRGSACRQGRAQTPVRLGTPEQVLRCVVMLERVDPFTGEAAHGRKTTDEDDRFVWIVCLADLLMVTDVLTSPTELHAYIRTRCEQTAAGSPRIITESDALGAWLRSREGAWPAPDDAIFFLEASGEAINDYFTQLEMHNRYPEHVGQPTAPSTQIPLAVLASLGRLLEAGAPDWASAAEAVCAVKPERWRIIDRDRSRRSQAPRSRTQRKAAAAAERGRRLSDELMVKPGVVDEIEKNGTITLTVDFSDSPAPT
jgi:hypothetical protein